MNGESRGFAFVTFAHASCAAGAMANMAGAVLPGVFQDRPLNVAPSTRDQQAQVQSVCNAHLGPAAELWVTAHRSHGLGVSQCAVPLS